MMSGYLTDIRDSNEWEGVYFISEGTHKYYTPTGISKVIDPDNDDYDIWYSLFVNGGKDHDLDINIDQQIGKWSVFIDKRIENDGGELLGVCAIGVEMDNIRRTIAEYEQEYSVDINFTDENGQVMVDTETVNVSKSYLSVELSGNGEEMYAYNSGDGYVVSKYIPLLGWYLVVKNERNSFMSVASELIYFAVGAMILIIVVIIVINFVSSSFSR